MDQTLNERVGGDLHLNTGVEESKGGSNVVDVSGDFQQLRYQLIYPLNLIDMEALLPN